MKMTAVQRAALVQWITENIYPSSAFTHKIDSGSIKSLWEADHTENGFLNPDFYIERDDIDAVMVDCGFRIFDERAPYWHFNISLKSPIFQKLHEYMGRHPR